MRSIPGIPGSHCFGGQQALVHAGLHSLGHGGIVVVCTGVQTAIQTQNHLAVEVEVIQEAGAFKLFGIVESPQQFGLGNVGILLCDLVEVAEDGDSLLSAVKQVHSVQRFVQLIEIP